MAKRYKSLLKRVYEIEGLLLLGDSRENTPERLDLLIEEKWNDATSELRALIKENELRIKEEKERKAREEEERKLREEEERKAREEEERRAREEEERKAKEEEERKIREEEERKAREEEERKAREEEERKKREKERIKREEEERKRREEEYRVRKEEEHRRREEELAKRDEIDINIVEEDGPFYAFEDDEDETPDVVVQRRGDRRIEQPRKAKPVFSLNDKFLYIRELFSQDAKSFNNSLDKLQTFSDYEDAEAYFREKFGMNPEEPTAAAFLSKIQEYYN